MNSRAFCLFIFCVFVLESIFAVSDAVSNYSHEQNQITEQERRAADKDKQIQAGDDQTKSDTRKRALFSIGNKFSSSYPSSSSSGYGSSGYGHGYSLGGGGGGFSSSGSGYGGHHQYQGGHHYLPPSSHGFDHGGGHSGGHGGGGLSHHGGISSSLALKGLLIPIAGIALLGAAAALSTNPVLLQLGVINGRRKRSLKQVYHNVYPKNPVVRPEN